MPQEIKKEHFSSFPERQSQRRSTIYGLHHFWTYGRLLSPWQRWRRGASPPALPERCTVMIFSDFFLTFFAGKNIAGWQTRSRKPIGKPLTADWPYSDQLGIELAVAVVDQTGSRPWRRQSPFYSCAQAVQRNRWILWQCSLNPAELCHAKESWNAYAMLIFCRLCFYFRFFFFFQVWSPILDRSGCGGWSLCVWVRGCDHRSDPALLWLGRCRHLSQHARNARRARC